MVECVAHMTALHALLLGIVEGITEFLPISSTGHLILVSDVLQIPQTEFTKTFDVAIQFGAILSVVALYWKRLLLSKDTLLKVLAAFVPTGIIGLALHNVVKNVFLESTSLVLWSLLIGGIVLIVFEQLHTEKREALSIEKLTYPQAMLIGVFQAIAIIPGVSRAAATIVGGLLLGMQRKAIVEFSFLLAIPTMAAATGLDLLKTGVAFTGQEWLMLGIGFVTAFVIALAAVKWLLRFIESHTFTGFGVYRIAIAVLGWFLL